LRRVQTDVAMDSYKASGVEKYVYMAVNPRACPICREIDGNVYDVADAEPAKNAPPMHPRCHCTTAPYVDEDEYNIYKDEKDYRIINIKGKGYTGFLAAIYEPSKIRTLVTSKLGVTGQYLTTMAKNNNAKLAINGGKFYDPQYSSNGATPRGVTYVNGKCVTSYEYSSTGGIIGFDKNDVLVLSSKCTKANAEKLNIRDCVTCGPFLIVNGKASTVVGNGGWGTAPRTAIGQRKDGVVLWLVLDGRAIGRQGADMDDLIEIMHRYGAVNAANLDGGTSSVMAVDGKLINDPIDSTGAHKTRFIATGFGLIDK